MKKLTTFFLLASSFIIGAMLSMQNANANPIPMVPGGGGPEKIPSPPNNQNELIVYGAVGGAVVVVIVVSAIVLRKIRKKNVNNK